MTHPSAPCGPGTKWNRRAAHTRARVRTRARPVRADRLEQVGQPLNFLWYAIPWRAHAPGTDGWLAKKALEVVVEWLIETGQIKPVYDK